MGEQAIHQALAAIFGVVAEANRYFAGQEPWALKKTDPARMETVLWTRPRPCAASASSAQPHVPGVGGKTARPSGGAGRERDLRSATAHGLVSGTPLPAPGPVFPRYVEQAEAA